MSSYLPILIPYYGGKARLVKDYPAPRHGTIVEPFAGGAAYSLAYADRSVALIERYPLLVALWKYLIRVTPAEILRLPLVDHVDDLGAVPEEARWLVGWWLNTCTATPRKQASTRARSKVRPNVFWGANRRQRVAEQVARIKHWEVFEMSYVDVPSDLPDVTWFVDPPYQSAGKYYVHGAKAIDFSALGIWCKALVGQTIVCENYGADWLPFTYLKHAKSSAGAGKNSNVEAVWLNDNEALARAA